MAVLALPSAAGARSSCRGADAIPGSGSMARARGATLCLLNAERRHRGLPPLRAERHLRRAAQAYSRAMVAHRFFDHVSPLTGSTFVDRLGAAGYTSARTRQVSENIAWGTGTQATPAQIVSAWMHSAGHRANILTASFREIGIGIAAGVPQRTARSGGATYTTDFGARR